ncbi:hypothetical protein M752DRAFT_278480 [Aspergillus phoenicis ATCC 13157]|uniref:Uncharacterized protein n=1 Tax=Aspergillus phoenicis ATCC 13157 TaxID=1353007 RepID=A0A370PC81_ASPPH|nr:hypothetical protein CBS147346_7511 [Aspergillus niger]RDK39504.1 hypothetical protein M752DRAFT_278480 [Aspergillus phoenicis ATCC 13157]
MPTGLPYLQKLRKPQLTEWAELTDLQDYEDLTKPDLAAALDSHLQANESIFKTDARLADYYRRLSQSPRVYSPTKRAPKVEASPTPDEAPRSVRRRQVKAKVEREPTEESEPQTPGQVVSELPPSPAVVTDVIDRQTAAWGKSVSELWSETGVHERTESLRSNLSSVKAFGTLILSVEALNVLRAVVPKNYVGTVPMPPWTHVSDLEIAIPDLFVLVEGHFWAVVSLWALISAALPFTVAYFFNLSLQAAQAGSSSTHTRRSRSGVHASFDPLSFYIAKAVITYLVYTEQFTFWGTYQGLTIDRLEGSVPGGLNGALAGCAIGVIGTLYEAILRK